MPILTDPAREMIDLIRALAIAHGERADNGLAKLFGVEAWSSDFYQIIFMISARLDELKGLTEQTPLDDDQKEEMRQSLMTIQLAFGPNGLQNAWQHSLAQFLTPATLNPLSVLSGLVRPLKSYPKMTDDERDELLALIDQLQEWLDEHQLVEQDFIRQALLDGLAQTRFRLERIKWFGWGYTVESIRDVITAYFALERATPRDGSNTTAEAMLKAVGGFVRTFYERTHTIKDVAETGDWMLRIYGGVMAVANGHAAVVGLLGHG